MVINADSQVRYGRLVEVMDAITAAGVTLPALGVESAAQLCAGRKNRNEGVGVGRKLRSQDNLRGFYSFILASGIHLLFFLCNWGAQWGVEAGQSRIIPVYSRLVVVEEKKTGRDRKTGAGEKRPPGNERKRSTEKRGQGGGGRGGAGATGATASGANRGKRGTTRSLLLRIRPERPAKPSRMNRDSPTKTRFKLLKKRVRKRRPPLPPLGAGRGMVASYPITYHKDLLHEGSKAVFSWRFSWPPTANS